MNQRKTFTTILPHGIIAIFYRFCIVMHDCKKLATTRIRGALYQPALVNPYTLLCELAKAQTMDSDTLKRPGGRRIINILMLCAGMGAVLLWLSSLPSIKVRHITDLGLISVLPPTTMIALAILIGTFCIQLWRSQVREKELLIYLLVLICMLYGLTVLVEEAPRFAIVYRHAGYTEFITRTGTVNPYLDAYFNWPGFFILSAFLTQITGAHDVLGMASLAPVFFNVLYLGPLYMIFSTLTSDKRQVWLGLLFFYLTNWVGQDYFSPQGLNFFLYLTIVALLLKWFAITPLTANGALPTGRGLVSRLRTYAHLLYRRITAPVAFTSRIPTRQRIGLLCLLLIIFTFSVFSHPLTPFFIIASVAALVIFRCCAPFWLPIAMAVLVAAWLLFMAQPFLMGHLSMIIGTFGQVNKSISTNVADRVERGSPEHAFVAEVRLLTTGVVWALALLGGIRRYRQGWRDLPCIALALAPFSIMIAQSYGGEIILRIYLFALPMMAFLGAALFGLCTSRRKSLWLKVATVCVALAFLGGFFFTRYGNERMDYMTASEVEGVHQLYRIAPPRSLLIESWYGIPWQFQGYETYLYQSLQNIVERPLNRPITDKDTGDVISHIKEIDRPATYIIFTRSARATSELLYGEPRGMLDRLEEAFLHSNHFKLVYRNPDVQILQYLMERKLPVCSHPGQAQPPLCSLREQRNSRF